MEIIKIETKNDDSEKPFGEIIEKFASLLREINTHKASESTNNTKPELRNIRGEIISSVPRVSDSECSQDELI